MRGRMARRILFLIAFAAAVAVVGIGVAIAVDTRAADSANADTESVVEITGEPTITESPAGTVVVEGSWGKDPGQFGLGEGSPREGPIAFAVSAVDGRIAVLDWANSRVQVFAADGSLSAAYQLPGSAGGYRDIAFDSADRVVVLRLVPEESCVLVFDTEGRVVESYALPSDLNAERLSIVGDDIWVWTVDEVSYPVVLGAKMPSAEEQLAAGVEAFVTRSGPVCVARQSEDSLLCTVTKDDGTERKIRIESVLPLDSVRVESAGDPGATYLATRIYAPEWSGTESWCVLAVADDGSKIGQVRWPCTYWAGGEFHVGPDGAVYNMTSFEDHLEIIRYELAE